MIRYVTLLKVKLRYIILCYITLSYITLHYISFHWYITLYYILLHYDKLRYVILHFVTLCYITFCYITLCYITFRYIMLHCCKLHYVTLRYVTLLLTANPGPVMMFVSPRRISGPYSVNEILQFRCTADVGNPPQNKPWLWQWKFVDDMMAWAPYPYTNRIKDGPFRSGHCRNYGASTLEHIVSVDDNARMFRCAVNNDGAFSANFTIYT